MVSFRHVRTEFVYWPSRVGISSLRHVSGSGTVNAPKRMVRRIPSPFHSGACRGWRKVKTQAWREANKERWQLFERL